MKKYSYIVAASCVLVGAIGFASMYATSQSQEKPKEQVRQEEEVEQNIQQQIVEVPETEEETNQVADGDLEPDIENQLEVHDDPLADIDLEAQKELENQELVDRESEGEAQVGTIQEEILHLNPDDGIMWPIEGAVLLDYSTDTTIFRPTLQQYQYNPAMVFSAQVNDKVYFVAKGKITSIETNEETGCTVTQDIGDGYTAVYGQLKELNFEVGETVQCGQVVGYVNEPTKYYSVEGPNVYFQLLKDGEPVDPEEIIP